MGTHQSPLEASGNNIALEQAYVSTLVNLAQKDGVQLNPQFLQDTAALNSQLQSQGLLPNFALADAPQPGATAGGGGGSAETAMGGGGGSAHASTDGDSFGNGVIADAAKLGWNVVKAGTDVALAPLNGAYQGLKGTIGSEIQGIEDFAHGDVLGGIGHVVGAPLIGAFDTLKGVGSNLWDATKDIGHALEDGFDGIGHGIEGAFDFVKAPIDIALAPIKGVADGISGTVESEVTGFKDLAHGDILGGLGHVVGAPVIGAVDAVKGVASSVGHAASDVWHGIENIF